MPTVGMMPSPTSHCMACGSKLRRSFMWYVEQPVAGFGDGLHHVSARARRVPHIHAQPTPRIHIFRHCQHGLRRRILFIFRAMGMDGDANVVFLHHFFDRAQN